MSENWDEELNVISDDKGNLEKKDEMGKERICAFR